MSFFSLNLGKSGTVLDDPLSRRNILDYREPQISLVGDTSFVTIRGRNSKNDLP